ncbi:MAG: 6-phosphofructokinase [Bacilli bacterium]|nr:6-phosphofructokinase [Bacilli bacterium]
MKNLLVAQSGGPTSAINASLYGVVMEANENPNIGKVYGAVHGVFGLIHDNLIGIYDVESLKTTPSAYLGSVRYHLSDDFNDIDYRDILETVKKHDIGYMAFIGGNDSMDTVDRLSRFFKSINYPCNVIGVPKTIDNDLVGTDHTPGYGSSIKYIATTFQELKLDTNAYQSGRATIVEVMGRDAGWLTAGSKLACLNGLGPDWMYLPESAFNVDKFLEDVKAIYERQRKVLIAVSEGVRDVEGRYIANLLSVDGNLDAFGHTQLGGVSGVLGSLIKSRLGIPVRTIELNLMQRCAGHLTSKTDLDEAEMCGRFASKMVQNNNGKFVSMVRNDQKTYSIRCELVNVNEVANKVKSLPINWIINGNDISDDFIEYALPLIQGEITPAYSNGLPVYKVLYK